MLVGEHDVSRQDGEQLVSPRSWTSHPLYHQPTTDYDFAIVKLLTHVRSAQYSQHIRNTFAHPARFSARVSPVCLPTPSADYDSVTATVSGWGTLRHGGGTPNTLQKVQCSAAAAEDIITCSHVQARVQTMSNSACTRTVYNSRQITSSMLCAAAPGKDACQVAVCCNVV